MSHYRGTRYTVVHGALITAAAPGSPITPPTASHLSFTTGISPTVVANDVVTPAIEIRALDSASNVVTDYTESVTLHLGTNPGADPFCATVIPSAGIALFSGVSFGTTASGNVLVANAGTLAEISSTPFEVLASATSTATMIIEGSQDGIRKPNPAYTPTLGSSISISMPRRDTRGAVLRTTVTETVNLSDDSSGVFSVKFYEAHPYLSTQPSYSGAPTGTWYEILKPLNLSSTALYTINYNSATATKWIFVDISAGTAVTPGTYNFNIKADDAASSSFPIEVKVWDIEMPETETRPMQMELVTFTTVIGHYGGYNSAEGALGRQYAQTMKDNKITPYRHYVGIPPQPGDGQPSSTFDISGFLGNDSFEKMCIDTVHSSDNVWLWMRMPNHTNYTQLYCQQIESTMVKHSLTSRAVNIMIDEPQNSDVADFIPNLSAMATYCSSVKNLITIEYSSSHGSLVDIYCPIVNRFDQSGWPSPSVYDTEPNDVWLYVSCINAGGCAQKDPSNTFVGQLDGATSLAIDVQSEHARAFPWVGQRYNTQGLLYYAVVEHYTLYPTYDSWTANGMFLFGSHGDGALFAPLRPGENGNPASGTHIGCPTWRMKNLREGMTDVELMIMSKGNEVTSIIQNTLSWCQTWSALDAIYHGLGEALNLGVDHMSITTQPPSSVAVDTSFAMVISLLDSASNVITGATQTVSIRLLTNPSSASISGATSVACVAGVATFNPININVSGSVTFEAWTYGASSVETNAVHVGSATVGQTEDHLVFGTQPTNVAVSASMTAFSVQVLDSSNNLVASSVASITVGIGSGPGTISGTLTVAAVQGCATFTAVNINTSGSHTLHASAAGLGQTTSSFFDVLGPQTEDHLVFGTQPANGVISQSMTAFTVQVLDSSNNIVISSIASITVSIGDNGGSGVVSGTLTVAAVQGCATFTAININASGSYTFHASAASLGQTTSTAFLIQETGITDPRDISGLHAWFDGRSASFTKNANDRVSGWSDLTSQSSNFLNTDISDSHPTFVSAVINSQNVLSFNAGAHPQYLDIASWGFGSATIGIMTVGVVWKRDANTNRETIISSQDRFNDFTMHLPTATNMGVQVQEDSFTASVNVGASSTAWNYAIWWINNNNGDVSIRLNASAVATDDTTVGNAQPQHFRIGKKYTPLGGTASENFTGDIAEITIYSEELASSDLVSLENYFKNKYGLS